MAFLGGLFEGVQKLVIEIFFPKFCLGCGKWGKYLCENCKKKIRIIKVPICPYCAKRTSDGFTHPLCGALEVRLDGLKSLFYFSPPFPSMISSLKYRFATEMMPEITELMTEMLVASISSYVGKNAIFVPIPLHGLREKNRGFNQAELIANLIAEKCGFLVEINLLKRIKNTPPQVKTKSREKRLANLLGAFAVSREVVNKVSNKTIVLVDDVWTSGATMKEATRVLKKAGVGRVLALTLAH